MYSYEYPRPSVTVDCVIFGLDNESLKVLLIERKHDPFAGKWALPGGFVDMDETIDRAAQRELEEETGISDMYMEQLYTFGDVERDPRGRVISVAYYALVNLSDYQNKVVAASDASQARWFPVTQLPALAFDHDKVLEVAINRVKNKVRYQPIGFELLPEKFALSQLQELYEMILGRALDRRNFRKKILKMNLLTALNEMQKGVSHRAAKLYKFDKDNYKSLQSKGFSFEI
jgi:8-oxo-dGTP diphosphatase